MNAANEPQKGGMMFHTLQVIASCALTSVCQAASALADKAKKVAAHGLAVVAAVVGISIAEPAHAGGPTIPDVGIDVGAMAQNMGTALGGTLGEIIPVALGFVIVSIGVVWLVKWLRRS